MEDRVRIERKSPPYGGKRLTPQNKYRKYRVAGGGARGPVTVFASLAA
jgi:hypothetical protein